MSENCSRGMYTYVSVLFCWILRSSLETDSDTKICFQASAKYQLDSVVVCPEVEFVTIKISRVTEFKMLRMNGNLYPPFPQHMPSWHTKGQLNFYPSFVSRHV